MVKKSIVIGMAIASALVLGMVGCNDNSIVEDGSDVQAQEQVQKDFDGAGCVDTGDGTFYIKTPDGSSEDGYIPKLIVKSANSVIQIGCGTDGMAYESCMVYVDGIEIQELVTSDRMQSSLTISGHALTTGVHIVEVVNVDDEGTVTIYKTAQYEVVM